MWVWARSAPLRKRTSPIIKNLVSPPARSTPLVKMEPMARKTTMMAMAFISDKDAVENKAMMYYECIVEK